MLKERSAICVRIEQVNSERPAEDRVSFAIALRATFQPDAGLCPAQCLGGFA